MVYDAEGDILDVDFRLTGEKPRRGIELHDNITVWTNAHGTRILRLMFLSCAKLLEQPDLPLVKSNNLPARQRTHVLRLLKSGPGRRPGGESGSGGVRKNRLQSFRSVGSL